MLACPPAHPPANPPACLPAGPPACPPACSPFKRSWSGQAAAAAQWTGETLELRERGSAAQRQFLEGVMLPALDGLLAGEEWAQWEADLDRMWYDAGEMKEGLDTFAAWRAERRASKMESMLQEAAALENPPSDSE